MANNVGDMTKDLLGVAKSKGYDINQISGIIDSPEGQVLLSRLNGPGGDAMKDAASKAADGDTAALSELLRTVMSTKEGRSVATQVMNMKK
ncbi:MAG: hypothetical protein LBR76_02760 [Oscillospiraceae bacterium]|jgi:hypothetical protein|nr:hypothetical protein [Oscillospiraceae bacterium]